MSQTQEDQLSLELLKSLRYRVVYHIVLGESPIGEIELDHIAWRSGEAELKIGIHQKELHNQGYGTEAIGVLLDQAFNKMNLKRVYLRVYAENTLALRCYEKSGFRKEGRLVRSTQTNGLEEIFLMSITKKEFKSKCKCQNGFRAV